MATLRSQSFRQIFGAVSCACGSHARPAFLQPAQWMRASRRGSGASACVTHRRMAMGRDPLWAVCTALLTCGTHSLLSCNVTCPLLGRRHRSQLPCRRRSSMKISAMRCTESARTVWAGWAVSINRGSYRTPPCTLAYTPSGHRIHWPPLCVCCAATPLVTMHPTTPAKITRAALASTLCPGCITVVVKRGSHNSPCRTATGASRPCHHSR